MSPSADRTMALQLMERGIPLAAADADKARRRRVLPEPSLAC